MFFFYLETLYILRADDEFLTFCRVVDLLATVRVYGKQMSENMEPSLPQILVRNRAWKCLYLIYIVALR